MRWRRGVLVIALLAVAFIPLPGGSATGPQPVACQGHTCRPAVSAQRWASLLPGVWAVGSGTTGTFPLSGQAYVAVGDSVAAVGIGLTVEAYGLRDGQPRWKLALTGFRPGAVIMSVRAWPGVVTVGVATPASEGRTEVVIDSVTGVALRRYPATLFGGAVAASASTTTIIGPEGLTRYDNGTGNVRWRRRADAVQAWRSDGSTLYVADSAGGYLRGAPVTGLRVIDLISGAQRPLSSPAAFPFTGSLAGVVHGVVLFTSAGGIIAYSGSTGGMLWSMRAVVPEGADPAQGLLYLTSATGALLGVDPLTGVVRHSVSGATAGGSAGMYVVRGGVALGLDNGASGVAWGYSMAAGRVTWTAPGLPWPHYFADVSGIGGSAAATGNTVIIAACQRLAPAPTASPTPTTPASTLAPLSTMPSTASTVPSPATKTTAARVPHASSAPAGPARHPAVAAGAQSSASRASQPASGSPPASASTSASTSASATPSPAASPTPTPSPPQICAAPVLVALSI